MSKADLTQLLILAINSAFKAGIIQKEIYSKDFDIEYKSDSSPLTQADKLSNEIIKKTLKVANFPFLSEEDSEIDYNIRKKWDYYWIIDPLDGTKEFIKKNDEFSINIAFAYKSKVIFGVVYSPVTSEIYFNINSSKAYKSRLISVINYNNFKEFLKKAKRLNTIEPSDNIIIAASRSHLNEKTQSFINFIKSNYKNQVNILNIGSAIKICLVAEGIAQCYPRFGPTSEWDTAAGQAILNAVGGKIINLNTLQEIKYNRKCSLNTDFFAYSGIIGEKLFNDYLSSLK
ncbi:MAG: hypothetical protein A2046_12010 [Bacteroidetes bacterium GWA2_30_7]|nr:MAG: hypothetical protein A2046_12010 [Bacteroidetes bacterium GWA2_30_7]